LCGGFAELFERPALFAIARKRMDDREVLSGNRWDCDVGNPFDRRRKRRKKRERKMPDSLTKFGPVRSVPGINRVEAFQLRDASTIHYAQQFEARIGDSPRAIREPYEREHRPRNPHFCVIDAGSFQRGKRKNDVADRAWADEKATANGRH